MRRSRPIIGNLRLDHDLILAVIPALVLTVTRARQAVLQQAVRGQSADQSLDLVVDGVVGCKRAQRQACAQVPRVNRRVRAVLPQPDRMAVEAGDDVSVQARFERDVTAEPGG
jgi:hypothetical protein